VEILFNQKRLSLGDFLEELGLTSQLKADSLECEAKIIKDGQSIYGESRIKGSGLEDARSMVEPFFESSLAFYSKIEESQLSWSIDLKGPKAIHGAFLLSFDSSGRIQINQ